MSINCVISAQKKARPKIVIWVHVAQMNILGLACRTVTILHDVALLIRFHYKGRCRKLSNIRFTKGVKSGQ